MAEPGINPTILHPYATFLVVEYTGSQLERAIRAMSELLQEGLRPYGSRRSTILASGLDDPQTIFAVIGDDDSDDIDGFIFRDESPPSWVQESAFVDVKHHLVVIYRRRHLLAVHAPERLRTMTIRRIRKSNNPPPFRLIRPSIMRDAFLAGEAKGLWLHGVHPASTTKADAKNLSGQRLQDALNTYDDSTFALRAGRAALADDPSRLALRGTVGTTPGEGVVWNRPSADFADFVLTAREALELVHATSEAPGAAGVIFPQLARELDSLDGVHGAYSLVVSDPDFLPPGTSDEARDAALVLKDAIVNIDGDTSGPDFTLSVGPNGAEAGRLRGHVTMDAESQVSITFGLKGEPSHPQAVHPVRDALEHPEVFTVHYATGEVISGGTLTSRQTQHLPFLDWSFARFSPFDIKKEKPIPHKRPAQEIHDDIAVGPDDSLFSWVVRRFNEGWLTCDDGSGEVADFVHLVDDGTLSYIHVKGASTNKDGRQVAVTNYEEVTSQATKNLHFARDPNALPDRLATPGVQRPATWRDGERVDSRDEMIESIRCRVAHDRTRIVVVQPHQQRSVIEKLRAAADSGETSENVLRLKLLETLLTSARSTAIGSGADLEVIVSDD